MPFGQPTPDWPIGRPGVSRSQGVFDVFDHYQLVLSFLNMVCMTLALALIKLLIVKAT
jgi:hypothetical protein